MTTTKTPRDEAGMPIGGIGAGKVEFCRNGRFTNVTTNNNLDAPIVDGFARTPLFPRIKEGDAGSLRENAIRRRSVNSLEGLPGGFMAVHTPASGAVLLKTHGRMAFNPIAQDRIAFHGRFPRARVAYGGFDGLALRLDAFGSFDPTDEREDYFHSALPLGLFVFTVANTSAAPLPVSLGFSWQNLCGIGGYPLTMLNDPDPTPPVFRDDGLFFGHDPRSSADPRVLGDHSLRVASPDLPATISWHAGWNTAGEGREVWANFAATGRFGNVEEPWTAGALAAQVELAPGQHAKIVFALGWHMPRLLAAETRWDTLVRPSGAPPAPESPDRTDYGHAYARWFADSWEVAGYGLAHWTALLARVEAWQGLMDGSSLPPLMVDGICNDLCALVANTWYTREGHYAVNEAPTDMNGCFGTIDQRSVGCGAVALSFPALDRAELDLFAADQVREDDPRRYGLHWNADGGRFDLVLDRAGAILHDIGWDHLEGGRTGDSVWTSAHWPEHTSHFVLQCYQHALWTGDRAWLDARYPAMKAALAFQARLDQDGDGVPDLWGCGSFTYDTELYPHYGASAYVASLYLAALRVVTILAEERCDAATATEMRTRFGRVQKVLESLFDEEAGYYTAWRDTGHADWLGARAHGPASANSHVSQLAGAWWADKLGLDAIVDAGRRRRALDHVARHNVALVAGSPADEVQPDGTPMQSMSALVMGNFAAHAIGVGLADQGNAAAERIYHARYDHDGCPWDAPLQWSGPGNLAPQWGRWYMSHPASWFLLPALGGIRLDRLRGALTLAPSWPSAWGDELKRLPVFLPGLRLLVDARRGEGRLDVTVTADKVVRPAALSSVSILVADAADATVTFEGLGRAAMIEPGRAGLACTAGFERAGDRIACTVRAR